jgi:hypothetical protein
MNAPIGRVAKWRMALTARLGSVLGLPSLCVPAERVCTCPRHKKSQLYELYVRWTSKLSLLSPFSAVNKNIYWQENQLLTAEITIKSIKYLLGNEALNMQTNSQYFSTSFDGVLGLQKDVFRDFLEQPNGCSKYLLQQQLLPQGISQKFAQQ